MRNVTVYCKDCGKKLAWWDMFTNLQYEEEWECNGNFRKKCGSDAYISLDGKCRSYGGELEEGYRQLKTETKPCSLYFHTKYCATCAKKRHYHCGRPRCKGKLVKVHNKDGSSTKHTHGGW